MGHVLPGARKAIVFTYRPTEKAKDEVTILAKVCSIAYEGEAEDWDDQMKAAS